MSEFKKGDKVEVIRSEDHYLQKGETGRIVKVSDYDVKIQSDDPSHGSGLWFIGFDNIKLIEDLEEESPRRKYYKDNQFVKNIEEVITLEIEGVEVRLEISKVLKLKEELEKYV